MEKTYEKDGYKRLAHSPAECVQLEHAGWKEAVGKEATFDEVVLGSDQATEKDEKGSDKK